MKLDVIPSPCMVVAEVQTGRETVDEGTKRVTVREAAGEHTQGGPLASTYLTPAHHCIQNQHKTHRTPNLMVRNTNFSEVRGDKAVTWSCVEISSI